MFSGRVFRDISDGKLWKRNDLFLGLAWRNRKLKLRKLDLKVFLISYYTDLLTVNTRVQFAYILLTLHQSVTTE